MTLSELLRRKQLVVLGMNSGTSADGLDLAVLRIVRRGRRVATEFVTGTERRYPDAIRKLILDVADASAVTPEQLIHLDQLLGQFYSRAARQLIGRLAKQGIKVDAVASHGQTVRHLPKPAKLAGFAVRGTLQLGSPEQIAIATGLVTVGDFRQADIAVGNEGAPITVAAMARLFGHPRESRLIVNIGGMSNFFYLPAGASYEHIRAADCGPGNSLSDLLSQRLFGEKYDRDGKRAAAGTASERLWHLLMGETFFNGATVSTGRELFGPAMVEKMLAFGERFKLKPVDLTATAAELTVRSIAARVHPFIASDKTLCSLYLTGGGEHNRFFVRRLKELLDGLEVISIRTLGIDPNLVEAASYAVLGEACLRSEALPTRFDGRRQKMMPVLGRIVQPAQRK
jgi:anhydro-N-acetylmuramic acid kinase